MKPPKMSSSSRVFEKRGDPWVSAREGREKFGRILELENVDRDGQNHRLSSSFWERKLKREAKDNMVTLYKPKPDKKLSYADKKLRIILRLKGKKK